MRRCSALVTALFGLTAWPMVARAEDDAPGNPIVVTGRGLEDTPAVPVYDVQTIARDELLSSASGRIEDVLAGVAGFQQFRRSDSRSSNPSAQGVTLRALGGNATSRALVLLDGVPMADPFFGYIPLSALSPDRLSSARITRGGGSGAFGSGAVAGTIELTSADAAALGLFSGSALVDDRGDSELSGTLAPQLGSGFAVVSGRWDRGDGFWTTPIAQRVPASVRAKYDSWSASARFVAPLTQDTEIQVRGLAFDDNRTLRFAGADTGSQGADASVRIVRRGNWAFDALAYAQVRDFDNIVISSTTYRKSLDQYKTPTSGYGGKIELRPPVGEAHALRLGGDFRVATGNAQEVAYNATTGATTARRRAGGHNSLIGLFVEDDWTLGNLVLTAGARADHWSIGSGRFRQSNAAGSITTDNSFADRSDWVATWRAGGRYAIGTAVALRVAGYTGIRMPTLNELYRPFTVFPVTTQANAALSNEKLRGFEAGIDITPAPGVTVSATAFDDKVRNAIANVTIGTNLRQRRNVDAVRAKGVELSGNVRVGAFGVDGSLALTDAEVEATGASAALNGKRPAQTPKVSASGTIGWYPEGGSRIALTVRHTGLQYEDDLQTDVLPEATTIDAYAELAISPQFSFILRGENLGDAEVITRNQSGSTDLGIPRTIWAGVRVKVR